MSAESNAPVIIKRKKSGGGEAHHGGAWKVAYADFVTAMMAFFMLMWLLNATTEKQRKGLADYFSPTIPINRISGGGDGSFGGDSVFTEETLAQNGLGATNRNAADADRARGDSGVSKPDAGQSEAADTLLKTIEEKLFGTGGESMLSQNALRHVLTRQTDEGLVIELFDLVDEPLFEIGSNLPTPIMYDLVAVMPRLFRIVSNDIAVNAFIRSEPVVLAKNPVWDLSTDRADMVRLLLERAGLPGQRIQRQSGFADRKQAVPNPMSVRNNRVELILLRSDI